MTDQSTVASLWASVTSWFSLTPTTAFLLLNLVIVTIVVFSRFTSNKNPPQHQLRSHDSPGQHKLARAPSSLDRVFLDIIPSREQEHEQLLEQEPHYFHLPIEPLVEPEQPPQLARALSLLDRDASINSLAYKFPNPTQEEEPNWFFQAFDTNKVEPEHPRIAEAPSLLEPVKSSRLPSVYRSQQTETETNTVHKPKRRKSETKKSQTKTRGNMKESLIEKSMTVETTEEETEMVKRRRPQTARLERNVTFGDGDHGVDAKADEFINKFKGELRLQRLDSLLRNKEMRQQK